MAYTVMAYIVMAPSVDVEAEDVDAFAHAAFAHQVFGPSAGLFLAPLRHMPTANTEGPDRIGEGGVGKVSGEPRSWVNLPIGHGSSAHAVGMRRDM